MLKSLDFTSSHIPSLIRKLAVPASVGFIFNTLFNVVDTYWGGKISTSALAAMGLTFPVFFIILSMGIGMGTGTTALISQSLGAGRNDEAAAIIEDVLADPVFAEQFPMNEIYYLLGTCYQEMGMPHEAAEAFKRS